MMNRRAKCPVCDLDLESQIPEFCPNCGWECGTDITLFSSLSQLPDSELEYLHRKLAHARKIWNRVQDSATYTELVLVEGGTFLMGSKEGLSNEIPVHEVELSSFFIGKYPVTQKQWQDLMGSNPASGSGVGDDFPVHSVSWYTVLQYCNLLSLNKGLSPVYEISGSLDPTDWPLNWGNIPNNDNTIWNNVICDWSANGYRLPTEAEWEYAARGGSKSRKFQYSGGDDIDEVAWHRSNSKGMIHPVGLKKANEIGVHDMSGNIWEWCWDGYGCYEARFHKNPHRDVRHFGRILRGGSWSSSFSYCKVATRIFNNPFFSSSIRGVRLCRALTEE